MKESIVELKNVNKIYGTNHVVKDLNLIVDEGEFLTLLGSSGCGKTTTLRMIAGFEEPSSGAIRVEGESIEEKEPYERNVNTVFQSYALFPHKTIYDNIAYGLRMKKVPKEEIRSRVKEMMEMVQLEGFDKRYPGQLSGGQKQRVAIAGVLAMKPEILIFDEATAMLDPQGKDEIKKVIMDLHHETGLTIVSITHDIDEVAASDAVIALNEGKVVMTGTPDEIFAHEKKLSEIQLDIPFSMKLEKKLAERGIKLERYITMDGLLEELCRLHSNM